MNNNWDTYELQDLCDVRDGTHDSPKYQENGIPFITSKNLTERGLNFNDITFISEQDHKKFSQRSKVENGDILFGMIGTIGKPLIVDVDTEFSIKNVALLKFAKSERLLNTFAVNILNSFIVEEQFRRKADGGVQSFVSLSTIRKLVFPLPPFPQQKKIAQILSTCDSVIEKTEQAIAKYQSLKQGMMHDLFTRGIDITTEKLRPKQEDAPELYKESKLGWIPKDWEDKTIKSYTQLLKSGLSRLLSQQDIGIPVLISGNIQDGQLDYKDLKYWYVNDPQGANTDNYILDEGDILLCFINSIEQIGKLAIFEGFTRPCIYTTNLFRIKAKEQYDAKFLYFLLSSKIVQNEIKLITKPAVNQASFTTKDFLKIPVPLIGETEQVEIRKRINSIEEKIKSEQSTLSKYQQLKQGLMQDLLTGKVEVIADESSE